MPFAAALEPKLEPSMPAHANTPGKKSPPTADDGKKAPQAPVDDQPQREDEYLSKFLRTTNPESDEGKKDRRKDKDKK